MLLIATAHASSFAFGTARFTAAATHPALAHATTNFARGDDTTALTRATAFPRAAVGARRVTPPVAFEGGLDVSSLSDEQISNLLSQLQNAGLKQSEADRIEVFELTSPSVAFVQTSVVANMPFQSNEYPAGAGSGFVWDTDGHIVTNYHVVAGGPAGNPMMKQLKQLPKKVTVKLQGWAEPVAAEVIGYEADKDLAVLKVDPSKLSTPLTPLEIGTSSNLRVGQDVLALGNPFGLDFTLTKGIVSALGRDIQGAGGRPIRDCVQTDAAINPGNSGGPLLDSAGHLIGVNTMIYAPNGVGANVGIGFAIPVDTVRRVVSQIITFGQNARPSIGVSVLPDSDRERYARNLGRKLDGAVIADVVPGSPADKLKLKPTRSQFNGILLGDMVAAVNGKPVTKNEDLLCAVEEAEPDKALRLTVWRNCDPKRAVDMDITPVQRKALTWRNEEQ